MRLVVLALSLVLSLSAQRHKLSEFNTETEEGRLLAAIGQESDAAKKLQLLEQFVDKYPKHEGTPWALSQAQPLWVKAGQHDRAIQAGERLLAADPMDLEAAYQNLKASEGRKDAEGVIKWSAATSAIARKTVAAPRAEDESEEDHKRTVDYAKQVDIYTEYSLYATALAEQDPLRAMRLTEALEARNAASQYFPMSLGRHAAAAAQAKATPAALALGERAWARNQFHEDLLLAMADAAMQAKQHDKVLLYAGKMIEVLPAKPKPEGYTDADWETRRNTTLGVAYWMAGTTYALQSQHAQADKALRAALPLVRDRQPILAGALFYLGLANYQLGKGRNAQLVADAVRFLQQCAAIPGPYQAQAQKNMIVIRKETGGK